MCPGGPADYEDRPVGLWLLFSSYQLVVLTIAGALFALWR